MKTVTWLCSLAVLAALSLPVRASDLLMGSAMVNGSGSLNGNPISGSAVSLGNGDRLKTGLKSNAFIQVSNSDVLAVGENSSVSLVRGSDGVTAQFEDGQVVVTTLQKRLREVRLAGEAVTLRAPAGKFSRYEISKLSGTTYILPSHGSVMIYGETSSEPTEVPQGMMGVVGPEGVVREIAARSSIAEPQQRPTPAPGQGQRAGQVTAAIPADFVVRGGAQTAGAAGEVLFLNDILKTGSRGRIRFNMDDGSILTIGSNSQLQVKDHNAQAQQSNMEMMFGTMRAKVPKITSPGGKWEVRTSTAVCGVIGTEWFQEVTANSTKVTVIDGKVHVTPSSGGAGVDVNAGETVVATANSVSAPTASSDKDTEAAAALAPTVALTAAAGTTAATSTTVAVVTGATVAGGMTAGIIVPVATGTRQLSSSQP